MLLIHNQKHFEKKVHYLFSGSLKDKKLMSHTYVLLQSGVFLVKERALD